MRIPRQTGAAVSGGAAFAVAVVVATHAPAAWRLWGVDGFAYSSPFGLWVALVLAAGLALTAIFAVPRLRGLDLAGYAFAALPVVCALLIPAATALRGDGHFIINLLTNPFPEARGHIWYAPLAYNLSGVAVRLGARAGVQAATSMHLLDALAAVVFGAALLWHSRRQAASVSRLLTVAALVLTGSLPLLAGLVEFYAPVHALTALALALTGRSISRGHVPWLGMFAVLLAAAYHAQAAVLLPAFIWALPGRRLARLRSTLFLAVGVAGLAAWTLLGGKGLLAPFGASVADGYDLLDGRHVLDFLNLLAWSAPGVVFVMLPWLVARGRPSFADAETSFYLAATVATLGLATVVSPELGMARDADMLSLFAIPATFWGLRVCLDGQRQPEEPTGQSSRACAALLGMVLLVGLLGPVAQVVAQSRETPAVTRHERHLALDPGRSAYGWENLGIHYRARGDAEAEERAFRMALLRSGNPRYRIHLAHLALRRNDLDEAERQATVAIAALPDDKMALDMMGRVLVLRDRIEEAVPFLMRAVEHGSFDLDTYVNLAYQLVRTGDVSRARFVLDRGLQRLPATDGRFHCVLGLVEERQGDREAARTNYETAIELNCPPPYSTIAEQGRRRLGG